VSRAARLVRVEPALRREFSVKAAPEQADTMSTVFWWFKRGNDYVRYESREVEPGAFELRFVDTDGTERVETFDDARKLEERQRDLEQSLALDGWTGPHGWNL
jgi:hypothetical protein